MTTTQTQLRRDTATNVAATTPADGEPFYDSTNKRLGVGDGATLGGLPHASAKDVQRQAFVYPAVGGTGNAVTLTNTPPVGSYAAPLKQVFKAGAGNTTAVTLNVDGLGTKTLKKMNEGALADLVSGDLVAGGIYEAWYDGTQFQVKGLAEGPFSSGALTFLGSATASSSATIDLTSLFSADFDDYLITLEGVVPGTDNTQLLMRCSTDNSTFDSGANYSYKVNTSTTAAATAFHVEDVNMFADPSGGRLSGSLYLYGANTAAKPKLMTGDVSVVSGGSTWSAETWAGMWNNTANLLEAVRFFFSSGTIASGTFKVYGLAKS